MQFLNLAYSAVPFLIMMVAALFFCIFTVVAFRSSKAALWLIGFWLMFDMAFPGIPLLRLGLLIYLPDLICVQLAFVTLMRLLFARDLLPQYWSWRLFVAIAVLSFSWGAVSFGSAAGAAFRPEFYSIVVATYFMTFRMDETHVARVFTALGCMAVALMMAVVFRWIVVSVPITDLLPAGGSYDPMSDASKLRVVGAETALLLGQIFVVVLFYSSLSKFFMSAWLLVVPLALAVIGLQHRSVWLAVIAGIALRYSLPAAGRRGSTQILVLGLVLSLAMVPLLAGGGLGWVVDDVTQSAGRAVSMTDTAQSRIDSWRFGLDKWRSGGVKTWLLGQPIGTSMERFDLFSANVKMRVNFQIHNNYIHMLLHYGLLGLAAMLWLYARMGFILYRLASLKVHAPVASALILVLTMQLTFFITYGVHFMQGLFIGIAAAYCMTTYSAVVRAELVAKKFSKPARRLSAGVLPLLKP